ncbi:MAG TPA: hypothetical protein VGD78_10120 [Chthoniobacterales bacterium]
MSFYKLWFALHEGTVRAPQVIKFIQQLQARIGQKLLLVWDGLRPHPSRAVQAFLTGLGRARGTIAGVCTRAEPGGIPVGLPQKTTPWPT